MPTIVLAPTQSKYLGKADVELDYKRGPRLRTVKGGELGKSRIGLILWPGVTNASHALTLSRALMVRSREGEHPTLSLHL